MGRPSEVVFRVLRHLLAACDPMNGFLHPHKFIKDKIFRREENILENFTLDQVTKMIRFQQNTKAFEKIDSWSPFSLMKYSMS